MSVCLHCFFCTAASRPADHCPRRHRACRRCPAQQQQQLPCKPHPTPHYPSTCNPHNQRQRQRAYAINPPCGSPQVTDHCQLRQGGEPRRPWQQWQQQQHCVNAAAAATVHLAARRHISNCQQPVVLAECLGRQVACIAVPQQPSPRQRHWQHQRPPQQQH
jgi:hypothetical protein